MMTNPLIVRSWQRAGAQLGLSYSAGSTLSRGLALTGTVEGLPTSIIQQFDVHADHVLHNGSRTVFRVELSLKRAVDDLVVWPARSRLRSLNRVNRHDVFVGDREWDYSFAVRSAHPDAARRFLSPDRRFAIVAASPRRFSWTLLGNKLVHDRNRLVIEDSVLVTRVNRLIELAKAISLTDVIPAHGAAIDPGRVDTTESPSSGMIQSRTQVHRRQKGRARP